LRVWSKIKSTFRTLSQAPGGVGIFFGISGTSNLFGNAEFNKLWYQNWYQDHKCGYTIFGTVQGTSKMPRNTRNIENLRRKK